MGAESGPVGTRHEAGQKGKVLHGSVKERVMLVVEEGGELPVLCRRCKLCKWCPLIRNAGSAWHVREGCARVDEVVLIVVLCLYCKAKLLYLVHKESLLLRVEIIHFVVLGVLY